MQDETKKKLERIFFILKNSDRVHDKDGNFVGYLASHAIMDEINELLMETESGE